MKIELAGVIVGCDSRELTGERGSYVVRMRTFEPVSGPAFLAHECSIHVNREQHIAALANMRGGVNEILRITIETMPEEDTE